MNTSKRNEVLSKISDLITESRIDRRLGDVLIALVDEININDDTRPRYCQRCGHITYYDITERRHVCRYCDKR